MSKHIEQNRPQRLYLSIVAILNKSKIKQCHGLGLPQATADPKATAVKMVIVLAAMEVGETELLQTGPVLVASTGTLTSLRDRLSVSI